MVSPASPCDSACGTIRPVRKDVGAATPHPALLAGAKRVPREGNLQRDDAEESICASAETGMPLRQFGQRPGRSRKGVPEVLRSECRGAFRVIQGSLAASRC